MLGIILQWNHLVRILGKEESPSTQCSEGDLYWAPPHSAVRVTFTEPLHTVQWGWPLLSPSTQCSEGVPLLSPSTQCSEGDLYWAPPHSAVRVTFTEPLHTVQWGWPLLSPSTQCMRVTFTESPSTQCSEGDLYWAPPHSAVRVTFTEPLHTVQWGWPLLQQY